MVNESSLCLYIEIFFPMMTIASHVKVHGKYVMAWNSVFGSVTIFIVLDSIGQGFLKSFGEEK